MYYLGEEFLLLGEEEGTFFYCKIVTCLPKDDYLVSITKTPFVDLGSSRFTKHILVNASFLTEHYASLDSLESD